MNINSDLQYNTDQKTYTASAPGSIMLFGEHAVLYGGQALVAAINQQIHLQLTPRLDEQIIIQSDRLGHYQTTLKNLTIQKPFDYVLTTLLQYQNLITHGFNLTITSEFADNLGLGSSAAVTVALVKILTAWLQSSVSLKEVYLQAKKIIVLVQGMGSGADVAASTFGGLLAYKVAPLEILPLNHLPEISLIYCGYKTPTKVVIEQVAKRQAQNPQLYAQIFAAMSACAQDAVTACRQQNWQQLGELMNIYQNLQEALGVSTPQINSLITALREQPAILGAKISGSGLGDCIWGLGTIPENSFPQNDQQRQQGVRQLAVNIINAAPPH